MDVQTTIYTGELKIAEMVLANTNALINGKLKVNWLPTKRATRGVLCVQNQLSIGDTSSANFLKAYTCLQTFIGQFGAGAIDPNAQNTGTTINVINAVSFNQDKIPFSNVTSLTLANYNTTYALLYGNNPILAIYLDTEFGDYQHIPNLTYATPGDRNSAITQIYYDFVTSVSGYLSIGGPAPASGSSGGTSGGATKFTFTNDSLLFDSVNNQWYLDLPLPLSKTFIGASVNLVTEGLTYDQNFSPARLYAFAPNTVNQTIVVSVI